MASYLQLGHASWNLLSDSEIGRYTGMVLSPVNDSPASVRAELHKLGVWRENYEVILDPQLYNPAVYKGLLDQWSYFPENFATANHSDTQWWIQRGLEVVGQGADLGVEAVCSPAMFPRMFSDEYYNLVVEIADATHRCANENGLDTLLTAIVSLRDLNVPSRAYEIASILTRSRCDRIYLTFLSEDVSQQKEPLRDPAGLPTAIHLIRLLSNQMRVHVAFSGHDLILWKYAGASDISSGKFMNLRRFSPGRWEEEAKRGQNIAYWNEGSLLTLLRDADVQALMRSGWFVGREHAGNPASDRIMDIFRSGAERPWVKQSWLQYLRWISIMENAWDGSPNLAEEFLEESNRLWGDIVDVRRILFHDRYNDGTHVRNWLNAVREGGAR